MSRRSPKPLSDLADAVLTEVSREQVVKTAGVSHTSGVSAKTPLGLMLSKVASAVRKEAGNTEIDYDDLANFRETYGI